MIWGALARQQRAKNLKLGKKKNRNQGIKDLGLKSRCKCLLDTRKSRPTITMCNSSGILKKGNKFINKQYKLQSIKLLEENIMANSLSSLLEISFFFDLAPKAKATQVEISKWDDIKHKCFFKAKDTSNETEKQPTDWGKMFANHMCDKGLISRIYPK